MPSVPIKMKDKLDRFYTKECVAKMCIDKLLLYAQPDDLFVEPSAGAGAFYNQLPPNKIGVDLSPTCQGVLSQDWLDYDVPDGCVVVGNPPFGSRNVLTKAFIRHSLSKARIIAFILPSSYKKETMQRVFPKTWKLLAQIDLPNNSFLLEGDEYHVPCVFQVWSQIGDTDLRECVKVKTTTDDFSFVSKDDAQWFLFGASPQKIIKKELVQPTNRGYYLYQNKEGVIEVLKGIDWKSKANSSVSGGVAWYSKQEIINAYEEAKNENS